MRQEKDNSELHYDRKTADAIDKALVVYSNKLATKFEAVGERIDNLINPVKNQMLDIKSE